MAKKPSKIKLKQSEMRRGKKPTTHWTKLCMRIAHTAQKEETKERQTDRQTEKENHSNKNKNNNNNDNDEGEKML